MKVKQDKEQKCSNNDIRICNQLKELILRYDRYLEVDEGREMDEYEQGEHDQLLTVLTDLKELLNQGLPK